MSVTDEPRAVDPPDLCAPPLRVEELDEMNGGDGPVPEDVSPGELYRAIAGLRGDVGQVEERLGRNVEASEARLRAELSQVREQLKNVVYEDRFQAEMRAVQADVKSSENRAADAEKKAEASRMLSFWAVGILLIAVLGSVVVAVVNSIG